MKSKSVNLGDDVVFSTAKRLKMAFRGHHYRTTGWRRSAAVCLASYISVARVVGGVRWYIATTVYHCPGIGKFITTTRRTHTKNVLVKTIIIYSILFWFELKQTRLRPIIFMSDISHCKKRTRKRRRQECLTIRWRMIIDTFRNQASPATERSISASTATFPPLWLSHTY